MVMVMDMRMMEVVVEKVAWLLLLDMVECVRELLTYPL